MKRKDKSVHCSFLSDPQSGNFQQQIIKQGPENSCRTIFFINHQNKNILFPTSQKSAPRNEPRGCFDKQAQPPTSHNMNNEIGVSQICN